MSVCSSNSPKSSGLAHLSRDRDVGRSGIGRFQLSGCLGPGRLAKREESFPLSPPPPQGRKEGRMARRKTRGGGVGRVLEACTYPHGTRASGPLSEQRVKRPQKVEESGSGRQRAGNLNVPAPKGRRQSDFKKQVRPSVPAQSAAGAGALPRPRRVTPQPPSRPGTCHSSRRRGSRSKVHPAPPPAAAF